MRVSAVALIRVFDSHGRLAVLGDLEKYKRHGQCVLSPIGGVIEMTDEGYKFLATQLKVQPLHFEEGKQLRLLLSDALLPQFQTWFMGGIDLEAHPARTRFSEQLVKKHGILTSKDASACGFHPHIFQRYSGPGQETGKEGIVTEYFCNIYNVKIPSEVLAKMVESTTQVGCLLKFVTPAEIKGQRVGACRIDPICRLMLKN